MKTYNLNLSDSVCVLIKDNNQKINGKIKSLKSIKENNMNVGYCLIKLEEIIKISPVTEATIIKDNIKTSGVIINYNKDGSSGLSVLCTEK
jgi:hypothetical protein